MMKVKDLQKHSYIKRHIWLLSMKSFAAHLDEEGRRKEFKSTENGEHKAHMLLRICCEMVFITRFQILVWWTWSLDRHMKATSAHTM